MLNRCFSKLQEKLNHCEQILSRTMHASIASAHCQTQCGLLPAGCSAHEHSSSAIAVPYFWNAPDPSQWCCGCMRVSTFETPSAATPHSHSGGSGLCRATRGRIRPSKSIRCVHLGEPSYLNYPKQIGLCKEAGMFLLLLLDCFWGRFFTTRLVLEHFLYVMWTEWEQFYSSAMPVDCLAWKALKLATYRWQFLSC